MPRFNSLTELFSDEKRWAKGDLALKTHPDGSRWSCAPEDPRAECFCLTGAVRAAVFCGADEPDFMKYGQLLDELINCLPAERPRSKKYPSSYNDDPGTTIEDIRKVIAVFEAKVGPLPIQ